MSQEEIGCWKEESVHVPNCKSFLVTEAENKHVRLHSRFQQYRDVSCHSPPPLQGKAPKEIHAILIETLWEYAPSYATIKKNWVAQLKRCDFFTCVAPRPRRPKTVTKKCMELRGEYVE
jgi:hypothetical protein